MKVATGYQQHTLEDDGISVRLGDAFSNETKDLLVEVDVSALSAPHESQPLFTAQVGSSGPNLDCWCTVLICWCIHQPVALDEPS